MLPRSPRVIVVDDHEDTRAMLALALYYTGFDVTTVATAEEALPLILALAPDAVVTDVRLPGDSGLVLSRRLRDDVRTRDVAILLLTGDVRSRTAAAQAGSDGFLLKPVPPSMLADAITTAVAARAARTRPDALTYSPA